MRWPPWHRDGAGSGAVPARPAPRPAEPGWAFLPPLQRTIAPAPRITAPHDLVTWRSPAFTGRMSHAVSTAAPAGVVDGDGLGLAAGSPLTREPVLDLPLLVPPAAEPDAVPVSPPARVAAPAPQRPSLTVSRAVEVPMPVARAVARPVADPVPSAAPDTAAATADTPPPPAAGGHPDAPARQSSQAPADRPALFADPGAASVFSQGMVLHDNGGVTEVALPRPLPAAATPLAAGGRPAAAAGPKPAPVQRASAAVPEVPAGPVAPPRRLGLGAPLPSMPVAQRAAGDAAPPVRVPERAERTESTPAARPEPPRPAPEAAMPVQRVADPAAPGTATAGPQQHAADRAAPHGAAATAPVTEQVPVLADLTPAVAPEPPAQPGDAATGAPAAPRAPLPLAVAPPPAAQVVPGTPAAAPPRDDAAPVAATQRSVDLLGARPLRLRVAADASPVPHRAAVPVQRAALLPPAVPASGPPPQLLPSHVSQPASRAATATVSTPALAAVPPRPAAAAPSTPPVDRPPTDPAGALRVPQPSPAVAPVLVPATRPSQPAVPAALPLQRLAGAPVAGAADQLRLAVAYRPQPAVDQQGGGRDGGAGAVAGELAVQREADAAAPAPSAEAAADTAVTNAATTAESSAAGTAGAAAGPASPEDLDKLAARLVEPLTRRLKAEMIIDRERRGVRSDPR